MARSLFDGVCMHECFQLVNGDCVGDKCSIRDNIEPNVKSLINFQSC